MSTISYFSSVSHIHSYTLFARVSSPTERGWIDKICTWKSENRPRPRSTRDAARRARYRRVLGLSGTFRDVRSQRCERVARCDAAQHDAFEPRSGRQGAREAKDTKCVLRFLFVQ